MANRRTRHQQQPPVDDSYSEDDDDDIEAEVQIRRPGRPRRTSLATSASAEGSNVNDDDPSLGIQVGRRGRGPSKSHCSNRNAVMARVNRERKKRYVESIEEKLKTLDKENKSLKSRIIEQDKKMEKLNEEVAYMRNVMKNQTMISTLLKALNDGLTRMHGSNPTIPGSTNTPDKSMDVQNWVASGQANQLKTNLAVPPSELHLMDNSDIFKDDRKRSQCGLQSTSPPKIARKSMPLTKNFNFKSENPSSVESNLEEDDKMSHNQKSSSESVSYCEYSRDQSSSKHGSQPPTTPMSQNVSESMDKYEASLSETEYEPDLLLNFDESIFHVDENSPNLFNHEPFFDTFEKEPENICNQAVDPQEISRMPNAFLGKSSLKSPENTGVCLHINSTRVSLEYCSICHSNSLKSQLV